MAKTIRSPRHRRLIEILVAGRRQAGLTQTALAERLGRPQSFVAKYENGERRLDIVETIDIAAAMGVCVENMIEKIVQNLIDL